MAVETRHFIVVVLLFVGRFGRVVHPQKIQKSEGSSEIVAVFLIVRNHLAKLKVLRQPDSFRKQAFGKEHERKR